MVKKVVKEGFRGIEGVGRCMNPEHRFVGVGENRGGKTGLANSPESRLCANLFFIARFSPVRT